MRQATAYFIGGPFDLTKRVMESAPREWYCLAPATFDLSAYDQRPVSALQVDKHRYVCMGPVPYSVDLMHDRPVVYVYQGKA